MLASLVIVCMHIYAATSKDVCNTALCRSAANVLLETMDTSAEPCDDFYQYACGKWGQQFPIQKYESSTSLLRELGKNAAAAVKKILEEKSNNDSPSMIEAKKLYKSCMDEDTLNERGNEDVWNLLEELGGMPLLGSGRGGGWNEDNFDLEKLLAKTGIPILFKLMIQENVFDTDRYTIYFQKAEYRLPDESLYKKGINDKVMESYMKELIGIAKLLGADENNATIDIYNVLQLEISLAKVQNDESTLNATVDLLSQITEKFDWARFLKVEIGFPAEPSDVFLMSPIYAMLSKLEILQYTPKRTIANLILLRLVSDRTNVLPGPFRRQKLEVNKLLYGRQAIGPLWKSCVNYVERQMSLAVGQKFVEREFSVETKNMVTEMAYEMKRELKSLIEKKDWLDEPTRAGILEKIDALGVHIGYPDKIRNTAYLTEIFSEYKFDEKQLFKNDMLIRELKLKEMISKFKAKVDDDEWPVSVSTVNAINHALRVQIYIPAAIIQPPLFNVGYPKFMNYAMIGKIIGHEIVHSLDKKGMKIDKTGSLFSTWWSKASAASFTQRVSCIIQQYSNFTDEDANMKLNGGKTVGDDISDNSGLRATYKAYKRTQNSTGTEAGLPGIELNKEQLFFLSAAHLWCGVERPEQAVMDILKDVHSIGRFRVTGMLQNNEAFSKAFNCPLGSYMNPKDKCIVW